ncbi:MULTISPECIES: ABC transporter permease [unclassified Oceanispirochaeta]|uniref:ABC transporter permease n=1 Tax=unclassified Oceanispirochaeta TaxID=2635722 RepID=UPI0013142925|nr:MULTISPECIES: ABC transporter permease [unclassified Oceanispirochaeta]MBF9018887.1 ABC transporter permease [Oceanispirochaeta sp. M2]NPD75380.1 ABC transporter permease [Oceanispirochaeta sp. M1]
MIKKGLSLFILIFLWYLLSLLAQKSFLPLPHIVLLTLVKEIVSGDLSRHLGVSLLRILGAQLAAFIPALFLGIGAGRNKTMDSLLSPMVYFLFPIPKIALLPIILLFLGLGNLSKIFLVALIVFFQYYLNIRDGVTAINKKYFDSMTSLGGGSLMNLTHLILPAVMPCIYSTLRLTLGTSIAVLFLAETFATRSGIGWYIMDAWGRISYNEMFAGIAALSLTGLLLMEMTSWSEKRFSPWNF